MRLLLEYFDKKTMDYEYKQIPKEFLKPEKLKEIKGKW